MTGQGDKPTGLRRHLEGWQLGVAVITMALLAMLLALPRPAPPEGVPYPNIDHERLAHEHTLARQRAQRRHLEPLPYDVRAVGEAVRRFGASWDASETVQGHLLADLRSVAKDALVEHGAEPLLDLQSLQTELFLAALSRFEGSGRNHQELRELGGNFIEKAEQSGWLAERHRLVMTEQERRVAFRMHWTGLVGLEHVRVLAPSALERRLYYAFLLHHPDVQAGDVRQDRARRALSYLSALVKVAPDYPADYARGVLYYEAGMYQRSLQAFQRHLIHHPDGPWTLRARNFFLSASEKRGRGP